MLIAYVKINILSGKCIEFEQTVFSLQKEFVKTKGCLNYHIYKDMEQDRAYFLKSEWQNKEALENHFKTTRFDVLLGAINNLCEPLEIKFQIALLLENDQSQATAIGENSFTQNIRELS